VKHQIPGPHPQEPSIVAKPELGTKRLCANCGAKFYDLSKTPIVCPKCATVFQMATPTRARAEPVAAPPPVAKAPVKEPEVVKPEVADTEFVSLEEADAESQGKGPKVPAAEGEAEEEIEMDEPLEDAAFIEQQEEGDEDVAGIVGEGREDEEET
jgi:uncharacterized protein (TIGR02300 family)